MPRIKLHRSSSQSRLLPRRLAILRSVSKCSCLVISKPIFLIRSPVTTRRFDSLGFTRSAQCFHCWICFEGIWGLQLFVHPSKLDRLHCQPSLHICLSVSYASRRLRSARCQLILVSVVRFLSLRTIMSSVEYSLMFHIVRRSLPTRSYLFLGP